MPSSIATAVYWAAGLLMGIPWLAATPLLKKQDRTAWAYGVFAIASLVIAVALKARIQRASGWSVWTLALGITLAGHFLVTWGLATGIALADGLRAHAGEPAVEALVKTYLIYPVLGLVHTAALLPLYLPLAALYVVVLRAVARLGALG
ncbi:MAG TPA: hypothetical protein VFL83_08160 [Anaeromyxobacter sp.]|nr:hypothetical protein [Anaeromyxobacter sp.]